MATEAPRQRVHPGEGSPPPEPMSYEQFLAWAGEETFAEWVSGKVVPMSPVTRAHATISQFLLKLISTSVEIQRLGEVFAEPFQMKTGPQLPGRAPDVIFVASENVGRLKETYLDGPADLVVEVISPESRGRDRGEKFYEYEEGGVKEYWLIDEPRKKAEFYQRGPDGYYRLMDIRSDGRFESGVLRGFWFNLNWLWQRPLPTLPQVLREWGIS